MASFASLLEGLLGGIGGAIGGAAPKVTDSTQSSSSLTKSGSDTTFAQQLQTLLQTLSSLSGTSSGTSTNTNSVNLSPEAQALQTQLAGQYSQLAKSAPDLRGFGASQTEQINKNSGIQGKAVDNVLAARGLSTSPAAGTAQANIEANRIGQITQLQQSLPLLQNQLQLSNLGAASGFFGQIPHGTTQVGTQTGQTSQIGSTTQTGTNSTNSTTGTSGFNSSAQNTVGQTRQGGGSQAGIAGGLAGLLAGLFG